MPSIEDGYEEASLKYENFGRKLGSLVSDVLQANSIVVHSVTFRVKTRQSAIRKQKTLKEQDRSVDVVHDFLGLRVITYFADQVDEVAALIEREFSIDVEKSTDKRAALDPDRFGYLSSHYVASTADSRSKLPEWKQFEGLSFEIQLRSILQHSWAEIEHDLGYKSPVTIPKNIKRRFSRLAGLLELADDEFSGIRVELEQHAAAVGRQVLEGDDVPIDQDSVAVLLTSSAIIRQADKLICDAYGARLDETVGRDFAAVRAAELLEVGFTSTTDISRALERDFDAVARFASDWLDFGGVDHDYDDDDPGRGPDGRYSSFSPGISVFYLYIYLMIDSRTLEEVELIGFGNMPEDAADLMRVHALAKLPR